MKNMNFGWNSYIAREITHRAADRMARAEDVISVWAKATVS